MSDLSVSNRNQYYTSGTEADTLLAIANEMWDLRGSKVLDPSVGAGAFPKAGMRMGLGIRWVTNELYPDNSNWNADTQRDFLEMAPGEKYDAVISNPPYTGYGEVDGVRYPLYEAFLHHALKHTDRVAYVMPLPILKRRVLARLPEGVELVGWTAPKRNPYLLGGYGTDETQEVATTLAFFERTGAPRLAYDGMPPEGLEWLPDRHPEATHAITSWGAVGQTRCLRKRWGAVFPSASEHYARITSIEVEALLATDAIAQHMKLFSSASPSGSKEEIAHCLNVMLKASAPG